MNETMIVETPSIFLFLLSTNFDNWAAVKKNSLPRSIGAYGIKI